MTSWPSSKARQVLSALYRIGWTLKRQSGSHKTLSRPGWPDVVFAFHDGEEIGPRMLARVAKRTGLTPDDLWPPCLATQPRRRARRAARGTRLAANVGRLGEISDDV
jgi:predicted RNA binding protein YcfA (HicA-like mRNA interferase family)